MSNDLHPIFEAIEETTHETQVTHRLVGEITELLFRLPFPQVAIIHEIVHAFENTGTTLFQYSFSEILNNIEKPITIGKEDSGTQEGGN